MLVRVSQMWSRNESPRRDFSLRDRRSPLPTTAHVADSQRSSRTRCSKNSVCEDSQRRRSRLQGNVAHTVVDRDWRPFGPAHTGGPSMHNRIDIDHRHSLAISREIGERLQASLRVEPELPPSIRNWIERFRELDDQSPSIASTMERGAENEPRTSERSAETAARTRLGWWRRKH